MISARTTVVAPGSGVKALIGAYIVHPADMLPPWKKETPNRSPENRYSQ